MAGWIALLSCLGDFGEHRGGAMAAQGLPKLRPISAELCGEQGVGSYKITKTLPASTCILLRFNVLRGTVADMSWRFAPAWRRDYHARTRAVAVPR